ncbi:cytochrome P450 [Nocardioides acrostichi]|uniref:Cytochrome P450 n=1 Tax=Nocardioides acrostichi TaxID=2784339 RepID=A0A930Y7J0_9ACTN|nr:cytochrome P450 [Nocardioides acrostichi]MBF4163475.1 cytochrome P450 [Nocardioides acrostichi]
MQIASFAREEVRRGVRWSLGHALPTGMTRIAARRGDLQGRLMSRNLSQDTAALQSLADEIRRSGPLHTAKFAHVTASLPVVREVLSSNDFGSGVFTPGDGPLGRLWAWADDPERIGPLQPPSLLVTEPPSHTRYRKLVTRVFTVRAVERLRERTAQIGAGLLDDLAERAERGEVVDLVAEYCALLPVTVIAEVLGVPPEDRQRVLDFGTAAAPSLDLGLSFGELRSVERALDDFRGWLIAHLERLREQPGEDLMSQLVAVQDEEGGLNQAELLATAGLVLAAGFETTVNLLGNGIVLLREHPEQLERLRAEPDLMPNAVDEILRFDPPVLLTGRVAVRDTDVAGRRIRCGSIVTTLLAGANRDPEVFANPHAFDVARENARDHVSFSAGRHYCLGAALARMEGEVGLRALFDRYPDLVLLPGARRRPTRILRGWGALPTRLA